MIQGIDFSNVYHFSLANGGCALVDTDNKKLINGRWLWHAGGRGVYQNDKRQVILLHNMIAPFERVSFKNGFKWDCRRENLTKEIPIKENGTGRLRRDVGEYGSNIYHYESQKVFCVHRKVVTGCHKHVYYTHLHYGENRSKSETLEKAGRVRDELFQKTRDEFIEFVKSRPTKRVPYSEILLDFDSIKGHSSSTSEMIQLGVSSYYDQFEENQQ